MAHERPRHVDDLFKRLLAFSPLVGIFGHRQVGKSTFVSNVAADYRTLDDNETRQLATTNAKKFISNSTTFPIAIDECQLEPSLFPALKERVRLHKRPGQFILTGSVRFTSRKAIRESLAGRLVSLELLPFTVSELLQAPLPDILPSLVEQREFTTSSLNLLPPLKQTQATAKTIEKYLEHGGLPGLCFIREERLRQEALTSLHSLILDRDLRLIVETRLSLATLTKYLQLLASNGWKPINLSEFKRRTGLAHQTQKQLLFALESIFMIRRIPMTARGGEIILLEDQYEERVLSNGKLPKTEQLLSAFFRNARAQFQYRLGNVTQFESYQTRSGANVPLVIRNEKGTLGVIVFDGDTPSLAARRSADSFLRHEAAAKVLFLASTPAQPKVIDPRVMLVPIASVI